VRDAALRGLIALVKALPSDESTEDKEKEELHMNLVRRCWVARADPLPENRTLADQLWEAAHLSAVPGRLTMLVLDDVAHPVGKVRSAASEALALLLEEDRSLAGVVLSQLLETYKEKLIPTPPVVDGLGRIVEPAIDHWEPRSGIALALAKIAPYYTDDMVIQTASFFIPQGLGDRSEQVRKDMLSAAVVTIDIHGKATVGKLLPVFEQFLDSAPNDSSYDSVRQSVVILMGSLARHLDKDDPKVRPIIGKLISALATPSQQVSASSRSYTYMYNKQVSTYRSENHIFPFHSSKFVLPTPASPVHPYLQRLHLFCLFAPFVQYIQCTEYLNITL
jgi:hypothetical protein